MKVAMLDVKTFHGFFGKDMTSNKAMRNENGILLPISPAMKTKTEELYELKI